MYIYVYMCMYIYIHIYEVCALHRVVLQVTLLTIYILTYSTYLLWTCVFITYWQSLNVSRRTYGRSRLWNHFCVMNESINIHTYMYRIVFWSHCYISILILGWDMDSSIYLPSFQCMRWPPDRSVDKFLCVNKFLLPTCCISYFNNS
jgi:hypothetical protein